MLFCNEDGEMNAEPCVDLNSLGLTLSNRGLSVNGDIADCMASFLECFGNIEYEEEIVKEEKKEDV